RVAWTIGLGDLRIVLRSLVGVLDHQADRSAGRLAFERARQDLDQVRLAPLGGELAGPRLARIEKRLDRLFADRQSRRTPVHHRPQRRPMALTPGRKAKYPAECVEAH